jgi:hypothetical protein
MLGLWRRFTGWLDQVEVTPPDADEIVELPIPDRGVGAVVEAACAAEGIEVRLVFREQGSMWSPGTLPQALLVRVATCPPWSACWPSRAIRRPDPAGWAPRADAC